MELRVYNGEYFERSNSWFIVFSLIILLVVLASILSNNILGGVLVMVIAGGYIYYITKVEDDLVMKIGKNALQIGKRTLPWGSLSGFVLEYHTKKEKIHNIVIIGNKKEFQIYTINDDEKNLEKFVNELNDYIPMLENYNQSTFEKFIRKLKL